MQLFLAVAEGRSVTAAAKRLGVTQPTASRRLAKLEASLGEALFARSVDGATLTAFGEQMLEPARRMAECAGEVERTAARADASPRGVVRITAPPGIAFEFLAPFASDLRRTLPDVTLEVVSSIQYLDLSRREADLALRIGGAPIGDLTVLATIDTGVAAFASKAYAKKLPRKLGLADVGWIGWAPPLHHLSPMPELAAMIPGFKPVFSSDDFLVQLRAAEAGVGAIFLGLARHRYSTSLSLVKLPLDFGSLTRSMQLVCAKSALEIPRVRALADRLVAELAHVSSD